MGYCGQPDCMGRTKVLYIRLYSPYDSWVRTGTICQRCKCVTLDQQEVHSKVDDRELVYDNT